MALLWHSLHCTGLEPNLKYLRCACIVLEQLTELREMFTYISQFIIKGIGCRWKGRWRGGKYTGQGSEGLWAQEFLSPMELGYTTHPRALSTGVSVPMELGYTTHPAHGCVLQPRSSSNLVQEFLQRLICNPPHIPFPEVGRWGGKF